MEEVYSHYHQRVVDACVALMGEEYRELLMNQCTFMREFFVDTPPEDVARTVKAALCNGQDSIDSLPWKAIDVHDIGL